jgi:hypothetical protein
MTNHINRTPADYTMGYQDAVNNQTNIHASVCAMKSTVIRLLSCECIDELLTNNEYEFTADGRRY